MKKLNIILAAFLGLAALSTQAYAASNVTNAEVLTKKYTGIAQTVNPEFVPSVSEGKTFYNRKFTLKDGKQAACASCHTSNPADAGKHIDRKSNCAACPSSKQKTFQKLRQG